MKKQLTKEQRELWDKVLAWLDTGGDERMTFNINTVVNETPCGTSACIAGAAQIFSGISPRRVFNVDMAYELLGSPPEILFFPFDYPDCEGGIHSDCVTPKLAAVVCRMWLETGRVDWDSEYERLDAEDD